MGAYMPDAEVLETISAYSNPRNLGESATCVSIATMEFTRENYMAVVGVSGPVVQLRMSCFFSLDE